MEALDWTLDCLVQDDDELIVVRGFDAGELGTSAGHLRTLYPPIITIAIYAHSHLCNPPSMLNAYLDPTVTFACKSRAYFSNRRYPIQTTEITMTYETRHGNS